MIDLIRKYNLEPLDHGSRKVNDQLFRAEVVIDEKGLQQLKAAGYELQVHDDIDETGIRRQQEVAKGDRYRERPQ
jgi:hypothetical protein